MQFQTFIKVIMLNTEVTQRKKYLPTKINKWFLKLTNENPWKTLANISLNNIYYLLLFQTTQQWKCSVQAGVK